MPPTASAEKKEKHVHKLRRVKFKSGNVMYHCAQPDCYHKIAPALALGKRSICWRCGEEFIINEYALRLAKPHCEKCHKPKEIKMSRQDEVIESFINNQEPMTLAERLQQTLQARKPRIEDEEI